MKTRLSRRRHFQCRHRYAVAAWSDERNFETFGACFLPEGHGHDYHVEVTLEGEVDRETGMILNLVDVDQALARAVAPLEGRRLDLEVPAFRDLVPTTENIARHLFETLRPVFSGLVHLRLFESDDLWVDAWP